MNQHNMNRSGRLADFAAALRRSNQAEAPQPFSVEKKRAPERRCETHLLPAGDRRLKLRSISGGGQAVPGKVVRFLLTCRAEIAKRER